MKQSFQKKENKRPFSFSLSPKTPLSKANILSSHSGLISFLGCFFWLTLFGTQNPSLFSIILITVTTLPIILIELFINKIHKQESTGLTWTHIPSANWRRVFLKIFGLHIMWALIALVYWSFAEYQNEFYQTFFKVALMCLLFLSIGSFFYIPYIDKRMKEPEDGLYKFSCFCIGKGRREDFPEISQYLLGWIVKAFFLPLMFVWLTQDVATIKRTFFHFFKKSLLMQANALLLFIFTIDVLYGAIGYIFTFRLLDTHIRSSEPTVKGWVVALMCYPPFNVALSFFASHKDNTWFHFAKMCPLFIQGLWSFIILLLSAWYTWATVIFGLRFSNLTNRGIITNGPYRFFKHPAYFSKNLMWWLASVPFLTTDNLIFTIPTCVGLALTNFVYYLRAKTEEKHLMQDPAYVVYSKWMEESSLYGKFKKYFKKKDKEHTPLKLLKEN